MFSNDHQNSTYIFYEFVYQKDVEKVTLWLYTKIEKFLHEVVVLKNYVRTPREELLGRKIRFCVF